MLHTELAIGIAVTALLGLLLLALLPRDRADVRSMLIVLVLLTLLETAAFAAASLGYDRFARLGSGAAAVGIGAVLIRLAGIGLFRGLLPRLRLSFARIVEDLVITALAAAWLMVWLHGAGLDLGSLLATSAVITAVLAFAMQDTLGNILGGVVLQLDDSVKVGDWVIIDDISGQVVDVRWRHTAVETRDRATVVIPNGWLVKNRFTVVGSRSDPQRRWRRWVWFDIDPAVSPGRVCQVLEQAVAGSDIANVVHEPPPSALLMEIRTGVARYALRFWIADPRPDDPTDSTVRMHALAALARHGIRLAVPLEERAISQENDARRAAERATELARRRHALGDVELFASLSDDERDAVAEALVPAPFVKGDTITRQGAVAHWLYLIVSGEADVWSEHDGVRSHVATLRPGSVFGEMGLMTGEPRRATVTARSDVECFRLDKAGFEAVLRARPDLAAEISDVIARRRGELDSVREHAGALRASGPGRDALRTRILGFFGLEKA